MLLLLAACGGGGDRAGRTDTTAMSSPTPANQPADNARDTAAAATPTPAAAPAPTTQAETTARKKPAAAAPKTQDTTKAAKTQKPAAATTAGGPTPQQIALGDSIFHGQVGGGTCTACHGQDAKGTAVAPDLTDQQWINGDGSYDFIVKTVTNGVPQPKQHPAPMPPKGGAPLTDEQVKAVAAYVYSLSHKS
jgi:mono/diheme cytochrome c family protein